MHIHIVLDLVDYGQQAASYLYQMVRPVLAEGMDAAAAASTCLDNGVRDNFHLSSCAAEESRRDV